MKSMKVAAGQSFSIGPVPAGAAIAISPGSGGSMLVQYRISDGGQLRDWPAGSSSSAAADVLIGPVHRIIFSAQTSGGVAEWGW